MSVSSLIRPLPSVVLGLAVTALLLFGIGPHTGAYRTVTILSDSMEPQFSAGDAIISTPTALDEIRVGDVISYHAPIDGEPLVTHRVTKMIRSGNHPIVETRGDANSAVDPWTARLGGDGPVWRQRAVIPHAGSVIRVLRQPAVRTTTVYVLPALLLLLALIALWRPTRSKHEEALEIELAYLDDLPAARNLADDYFVDEDSEDLEFDRDGDPLAA